MPSKQPIIAPDQFNDLHFPLAGIDLSMSFDQQMPRPYGQGQYARTTPLGQNVRAFEPGTGRGRGGQRPGIRKYVKGQVNGTKAIQEIAYVVNTGYTQPGGGSTVPTLAYYRLIAVGDGTYQGQIVLSNGTSPLWAYTTVPTTSSTLAVACVGSTVCVILPGTQTIYLLVNGAVAFSTAISGGVYEATVSITADATSFYVVGQRLSTGKCIAYKILASSGATTWSNVNVGDLVGTNQTVSAGAIASGSNLYVNFTSTGLVGINATTGAALSPFLQVSNATLYSAVGGTYLQPTAFFSQPGGPGNLAVSGNTVAIPLSILGASLSGGAVAFVDTSGPTITPAAVTGLGTQPYLVGDGTNFYALYFTAQRVATVRKIKTTDASTLWQSADIAVPNYSATPSLAYPTGLAAVEVSLDNQSLTLDASAGTITGGGIDIQIASWGDGGTLTSASGVPSGTVNNYNRGIVLLAVSGGTVKVANNGTWQSVTSGTTALSTTASVIRSAVNGANIYFADGANYKYYDPTINTMVAWTASAGSMPVDSSSNKGRLIANWRNRILLSGFPLDPNNIFMSAVNAPRDWDYSPASVTGTQAIALNNSPLGLIPDVVTCLMPYTDDVLFVGGDSSLWMIQGDPMAGGQVALVSRSMGVAFGSPWCQDSYGNLYFFSNHCGIYSLTPGQQPIRISQQIEQLLSAIQIDNAIIRLAWDVDSQGLHVYATPWAVAGPTTHFFWEQRTGGWFTKVFANNNHNPMTCLSFQGALASDRVVLIGSWDGYVRCWQNNAVNDDGTQISSAVLIGPLLTKEMDDLMLKDVQGALGATSGDVTFSIYVGSTAEVALSSVAVATGTWYAGRNLLSGIRRSGHAVYVKITASNPWAMEAIRCRVQMLGKVRRRGR